MTDLLLLAMKLCVGAMILGVGLGATVSELAWTLRRPRLLAKSILAMYVLVPLAALVVVKLFPVAPAVQAALLVFAASAGAPLLPKKIADTRTDDSYSFSLVVLSSLFAIVLVPGWIAAFASLFPAAAQLPPEVVAIALLKAFLLPLAIGMILRRLWPSLDRLCGPLLAAGGIAVAICGLALLMLHYEVVVHAVSLGMLALLGLLVVALAIGHALGGPEPGHRMTLALACVTRHIGIAVMVATAFPGVRTAVLVAAYTLASAFVSIPYLKWCNGKAGASTG